MLCQISLVDRAVDWSSLHRVPCLAKVHSTTLARESVSPRHPQSGQQKPHFGSWAKGRMLLPHSMGFLEISSCFLVPLYGLGRTGVFEECPHLLQRAILSAFTTGPTLGGPPRESRLVHGVTTIAFLPRKGCFAPSADGFIKAETCFIFGSTLLLINLESALLLVLECATWHVKNG